MSYPLNELVRVGQDLWYQVMLVVILKVVYLLEVLIVLPCDALNISQQALVLKIQPPVILVVIV